MYNYSRPSVYLVPTYLCFGILIQPTSDHVVLLHEKYSHVSGPVQFKPVLFKGQLYNQVGVSKSVVHLQPVNCYWEHNVVKANLENHLAD